LDVLNSQISKRSVFHPFYAGDVCLNDVCLPATYEVIPELLDVENSYLAIKKEMEAALGDRSRVPYMHDTYNNIFVYKGSAANNNFISRKIAKLIYGKDTEIFDRIGSKNWKTYNLILFNQDVPKNSEKCPITVSLLKRVPGVQSALFSIIAPGTYIPPHRDPAKGVIRYHLALKVPKDRKNCYINIDGYNYHWEEGKGILFDDVYDHYVRNDTKEERVILFVDILRPLHGVAKFLQNLANFANRTNPGVKQLIRESII
jgi:hypothetical protein